MKNEATIIHFNSEITRTDLPFVQYHIKNQDVKAVSVYDKIPTVQYETYTAKIHKFKSGVHIPDPLRRHGNFSYKTDRIALTKDAQYVVDLFLESERRKHNEQLDSFRRAMDLLEDKLYEEQHMSLWKRFKRYIFMDG